MLAAFQLSMHLKAVLKRYAAQETQGMLHKGMRLPKAQGNPHLRLQLLSQLRSAFSPVLAPPDHGHPGLTPSASAYTTRLECRWAGVIGPPSHRTAATPTLLTGS